MARAKPETVRGNLCGDAAGCRESVDPSEQPPAAGFTCAEGVCLARHPSGAIVAHALDAQAALDVCTTASVIVIDDATAKNVCRWKDVLVVTKRDLALNGSAAIAFFRPRRSADDDRASPPRSNTRSAGRSGPGMSNAAFRARRAALPPIGGRTSRQSPTKSRRLRSPGSRTQLHQPKPPVQPFRKPLNNAGSARPACPAP